MTTVHRRFLAVVTFASAMLLASPGGAADVVHVDVGGATELLDANDEIVVLDVRTPGEFEAIRIDRARNIDIDGENFRKNVASLDREEAYLVHCAAGVPGGRSERAVEVMRELGFTQVHHLDGGINAWKASGERVVGTAVNENPNSPAGK